MNTFFLPCPFLLGLCAYLNQAELSLDRMPETAREQITRFYDEQVPNPLITVTGTLRGRLKCSTTVTTDWREWERLLMSWSYICATWMSSFMQWHFRCGVYLPVWQATAITQTLEQFDALVRNPQVYDLPTISEIRLRLRYGALMLERRIPVRQLALATHSITHLNCSGHLNLKQVEEIAGTGWLERQS